MSDQAALDATARREEELYVHSVYESIADHFSRTRYKPWPGISDFFDALPKGSLGVDAGCGNGKYLGLRSALASTTSAFVAAEATASPADSTATGNGKGQGKGKGKARQQSDTPQPNDTPLDSDRGLLTLGLDRSSGLIGIAKERGHEVLVGDAIDMPWREGAFDFAISIATIHHFTTRERRIKSIRTILRALNKRHGKLFIQVWALEQDPALLPPEVLSDHASSSLRHRPKPNVKKPRQMDKLERATLESVGQIDELDGAKQDVFVPWKLQSSTYPGDAQDGATAAPTYQRYYHLFRAGELKELVEAAAALFPTHGPQMVVDEERWEEGNWWITARYGTV